MRGRQLMVGLVATGLVLAVAACGTADSGVAEGPDSSAPASVFAHASSSPDSPDSVPAQVTVHRPGFVDIARSTADLPVWPGPNPAEFLQPNPPTGEIGQLTGPQAKRVLVAARHNPAALWNVAGTVQWLVVAPLS